MRSKAEFEENQRTQPREQNFILRRHLTRNHYNKLTSCSRYKLIALWACQPEVTTYVAEKTLKNDRPLGNFLKSV